MKASQKGKAGAILIFTENKMEKEKKYFWSPSVGWRKTEGEVRIEIFSYSGFICHLFPELYFLTYRGITLGELTDHFASVEKNALTLFLRDLIKKKILVDGVLSPQEIFFPQGRLFENEHGEKIKYDPVELNQFVEKQLSRECIAGNKKIILPDGKIPDAIVQRRTHKTFDENRLIDYGVFSNLFTVLRQTKSGKSVRYYYASSGGLYPIDVYVHVKKNRVENVDGGLYYYQPVDNGLNLIDGAFEVPKNAHYFTNQNIHLGSAFSIFLVYNAEVTMPKYGGLGYFYAVMEAGIVVSTLTLAAESNGLGTCSIGEMNFKKIEKSFKLNKDQVYIHSLEVGLKEKQS